MAKKYFLDGKEIDQATYTTLSKIDEMGRAGAITPTTAFNAAQNVLEEYGKRRSLNEVTRMTQMASLYNQPDTTQVQAPQQPAQKDAGFLGNIINGLVQSGGNLVQDMRAGYSGLAGMLGVPGATEQGIKILSENERGKKLLNGTADDAVKAGINDFGFAASFVPAGGALGTGIGGLAKAGALSGGLGALGQSSLDSVGSTVNDVAGGAIMGAGTGAALGFVGDKLKNIGNKAPKGAIPGTSLTPEMKAAFPSLNTVTAAEENAINPIKGGLENMLSKKVGDQFQREGSAAVVAKDLVDAVKDPVNKDIISKLGVTPKGQGRLITRLEQGIVKDVNSQIAKLPTEPVINGKQLLMQMETDSAFANGTAQKVLETDIAKILLGKSKVEGLAGKTSFSLQDLYKLRSVFNDLSSKAAEASASGSSGVVAGAQEANYAAANVIRDLSRKIAESNPAIASLEELYSKLHAYNNVTPGIFANVVRPSASWSVQSAVMGKALPLTEVWGRNVLSGAYGEANKFMSSKAGKTSGNILGTIGKGADIGSKVLPRLGALGNTKDQTSQDLGMGSYLDNSMGTQQSLPQDTAGMLQTLMDGGYTPTEASSILKSLGTTADSSVKFSKDASNAKSGLDSLAKMDALLKSSGGVTAQGFVPYALKSGEGKQFDLLSKEISDVIARLRTGAAINKEEEALYLSKIPNFWDDPQTIQMKLRSLANLFQTVVGTSSNQQGTGTNGLLQILGQTNGTTTAQ